MFMKKLLLSTMMLAAGMLAANAAEETFQFSSMGFDNAEKLTTVEQGAVTLTFDAGGNSNAPAYYNSGNSLRMYGDNSMSVSVPDGSILQSITFNLTNGATEDWVLADETYYPVDNGTFTIESTSVATWEGDGTGSSVKLTVKNEKWNGEGKTGNAQFRVYSMVVTYEEGEVTKCSAPRFNPAAGTYWGSLSIELTCNTDGVTMYYTINDGAEQTYSAPIELAEAGTYTIKAHAEKSGIDDSDEVSATYVVSDPIQCSSIEDFIFNAESEDEGSMFEWTFPVTVTGVMPSYTYVRDEEGGAMLIYGNEVPAYEVGDVIPAGIVGGFTNFNGLYEMQNVVVDSFGESTSTGNGNPIVMTAGGITADDMNKVVYLDNVTLEWTPDEKYPDQPGDITLSDASGSISGYYQYKWEDVVYPASGTVVDVVCAVSVNKGVVQVYPMQFRDAFEKPAGVEGVVAGNTVVMTNADGVVVVAAEAAEVSVYTAAGQLVAAENVAAGESVINVPAGFYIVKAGDTVAKVIVK